MNKLFLLFLLSSCSDPKPTKKYGDTHYVIICIDGMEYIASMYGNITPKYKSPQYVKECEK